MPTLRAQGAEFLVKGVLEMMLIPTYHVGGTHPGYDLVATNPERNRSCRIQVKSRADTAYAFYLNRTDTDLVVFVSANYRSNLTPILTFYVFPIAICEQYRSYPDRWKLVLTNVPDVETYRDNWEPVFEQLLLRSPPEL